MDDYISREAAINASREIGKKEYDAGKTETAVVSMLINDELRAIPAADVAEVVRCRDCKYRAEDDFCTGRGWPDQLVADNGFCDKGKRKG